MALYSSNESLKASISDFKNDQHHQFYVENSDTLKFYYLNTRKYDKQTHDYTYTFSEVTTVKNKKQISLPLFSGTKKVANYKLEIEESIENYFPFFHLSATEPFQIMEIVPPSNFTVISAKGFNVSGRRIGYKLNSVEELNLKIELPEKLVLQ